MENTRLPVIILWRTRQFMIDYAFIHLILMKVTINNTWVNSETSIWTREKSIKLGRHYSWLYEGYFFYNRLQLSGEQGNTKLIHFQVVLKLQCHTYACENPAWEHSFPYNIYLTCSINIQKHLLHIDQKQFKRTAPLTEVIRLEVRCLIWTRSFGSLTVNRKEEAPPEGVLF